MNRRRGLSNIVAGIVIVVVTVGTLTDVGHWGKTQISRIPANAAEGVAVAQHCIRNDLIIVNYGYSQYTARLINEDGSICNNPQSVQLLPKSTVIVTTTCRVGR